MPGAFRSLGSASLRNLRSHKILNVRFSLNYNFYIFIYKFLLFFYLIGQAGFCQSVSVITWPEPAAISYGTALSATQLNATANVPGTFAYTPAAGTVLAAGRHTLSVTFTPNDTTNYPTASATTTLAVNYPPVIRTQPQSHTVSAGQSVSFSVEASGANVAAVASGHSHSLYLKTDGTLWSMGWNGSGQLGDGTTTNRSTPVQVATGVSAIAAGTVHSLYVKTDGTLWAMGGNGLGRLGDGTTTDRSTPVLVATGVSAVAAGSFHSLYLKTDGTLCAMGANDYGQLGDGTAINRSTPVQVATGVSAVAAGGYHSLYVKTDGTLGRCGRWARIVPASWVTAPFLTAACR
ncbi:MAG: hypothetical protein RLZZ221_2601 [Verrucomicrobiota bacterium]